MERVSAVDERVRREFQEVPAPPMARIAERARVLERRRQRAQRAGLAASVLLVVAGALAVAANRGGDPAVVAGGSAPTAPPATDANGLTWDVVFNRVSAEGVRIRAFETGLPGQRELVGELSTENSVGRMSSRRTVVTTTLEELLGIPITTPSSAVFGTLEELALVVVAQVDPTVGSVSLVGGNGVVDSMAPVNGWIALATRDTTAPLTLRADDAAGALLTTVVVPPPLTIEVSEPADFVRTTNDGVLIVGRVVNGYFAPAVATEGAAEAQLGGVVDCAAAGDAVVLRPLMAVGVVEGDPATVLVANVGPEVASLRAVFAGAVTDTMAVVNGRAVLAYHGYATDRARRGARRRRRGPADGGRVRRRSVPRVLTQAAGARPEAAGEPHDSFATFFEEHYGRVVRALMVDGLSRDRAEDVAQEAFTRTLPHWDRVRNGSSPIGYVLTASFRLKRRTAPIAKLTGRFGSRSSAEREALASLELRKALDGLPRRQRQCLALVAGAGMSSIDAAAVLGVSDAAVRSHLNGARRAIAAALAMEDEPALPEGKAQ